MARCRAARSGGSQWGRRFGVAAVALGFLAAGPGPEPQTDVQRAKGIKAGYLYKFTRYVDWPDSAFADERSPIVIGVLGADPFGGLLETTVSGKTVHGRPIEIRQLGDAGPLLPRSELRACHVLFVAVSAAPHLESVLGALHGASVLTVSDLDRFAERGGIIGLVPHQDRIVFAVNRGSAERAGLTLSAKLLTLARIVDSGERAAAGAGR